MRTNGCGNAFDIESEIPEKNLTRCTCSFCARHGALYAYCQPGQFTLATPAGNEAPVVVIDGKNLW